MVMNSNPNSTAFALVCIAFVIPSTMHMISAKQDQCIKFILQLYGIPTKIFFGKTTHNAIWNKGLMHKDEWMFCQTIKDKCIKMNQCPAELQNFCHHTPEADTHIMHSLFLSYSHTAVCINMYVCRLHCYNGHNYSMVHQDNDIHCFKLFRRHKQIVVAIMYLQEVSFCHKITLEASCDLRP